MQLDLGKEYILLLIDMVGCTELPPTVRESVLLRLKKEVYSLNRKLRSQLVLGIRLGYGDEVAALVGDLAAVHTIIDHLREVLHPHCTLRFAVVQGRIGVRSEDIRRVGGEVFKEAAQKMATLKKKRGFRCWSTGELVRDRVVELLFEFSNALIVRMTDYQRSVWRLLRLGLRQVEIARRLRKRPQSVCDAIERSSSRLINRAEEVLRSLLTGESLQPKKMDSGKSMENDRYCCSRLFLAPLFHSLHGSDPRGDTDDKSSAIAWRRRAERPPSLPREWSREENSGSGLEWLLDRTPGDVSRFCVCL